MLLPQATHRPLFVSFRGGLLIRLLISALGLLCLPATLHARERIPSAPPSLSETGVPNFLIYSAESLGIQGAPTDIQRLADGRLLVVGQNELSFGDGLRWELYRKADGIRDFIPRQLAIDADGRFIAPVQEGFAEIEFGQDGRWRFVRITPLPATSTRATATFQSAEHLNNHWYWHSNSGMIVQWDLKGSPRILGSVNSIDYFFGFKDSFYVSDVASGSLTRYNPEVSIFETIIPPSADGIASTISSAAPFDENLLLVGTQARGLQLFDGKNCVPLVRKGLLAGPHKINYLCQTVGGFYAAAVDTYGIVFFNREGRILQILPKSVDHRLGRVMKLVDNGDGIVWALLNDGVARIEFPSRLSSYDALLSGGLSFIQPFRYKGRLWLLADGKLQAGAYTDDGRLVGFEPNSPPAPFVFSFHAKGGRLLAPCEKGIYELGEEGWELVIPELSSARLVTQSKSDGRWLYVALGEIGWIDLSSRPYRVERNRVPALSMCYGTTIDDEGRIWLELGNSLIGKIPSASNPLSITFLDNRNGIPDGWAALTTIDGVLRLNCANRVMRLDEKTGVFKDDVELVQRYPEFNNSGGRALLDARGNLWVSPTDKIRVIHNYQSRNKQWVETLPVGFIPYNFYDDDSGVVWMHDKRRFLRYDPDMPQAAQKPLKAIITQVKLPGSNRSLYLPGSSLPPLSFADNSLGFSFLAPGNPFGQQVSFEFKLEGQQENWVSTGIVGSALFNRLKEGSYLLRVRPMVGDVPGDEARVSFVISPPWFRTIYAYLGFGAAALLTIATAVLVPLYVERKHKEHLEKIVAARTHELNETNVLLARQMKETLQKAVELKASEERYRNLNTELEKRVDERTEELRRQVEAVGNLNNELRRSQQEISRSAARLQEVNASLIVANHELESFSYTVSHDLRAPLRNVTGFIELLRKRLRGVSDKESDRYLEIVISEARRMGTLIDDLLTFSRIGRSEMKMRSVDLTEVIEQTRQEMAHDLAGRNVTWRIGAMPRVLGDQALLKQVIANLLGNALKFTRTRTEAVIEIGAQTGQEGSDLVTYFVRDNGVGFNPQYVDKLFRVFQRLHTNKDFEGTGIGLANVKRIITRHGGRVWAEGSLNGGATFYFTLRMARNTTGGEDAVRTELT